jgi:iron(III) transport system substrate-binding protein
MKRFLLAILFVFIHSTAWSAAEPDCDSCESPLPPGCEKTCNGARKEGKVTFYASAGVIPAESQKVFLSRLKERLPFLDVLFIRANTTILVKRIISEHQARRLDADIILTLDSAVWHILANGILRPYESPFRGEIIGPFQDRDHRWISPLIDPLGTLYNTKAVKPGDIPKTFNDLLDPKWKGNVGLAPTDDFLPLALLAAFGKETRKYTKGLSAQSPRLGSHAAIEKGVADGQYPIAIDYLAEAMSLTKQGAPVGWAPLRPVLTRTFPTGICASAPHPNAAKILFDFLLSVPGQKILREVGAIPANLKAAPTDSLKDIQPQEYRAINARNQEVIKRAVNLWQESFPKQRG